MTIEPDDDDDPVSGVITVCQGPPICNWMCPDGEDPAEHCSKCLWCKRIYFMKDGTESETGPGHA